MTKTCYQSISQLMACDALYTIINEIRDLIGIDISPNLSSTLVSFVDAGMPWLYRPLLIDLLVIMLIASIQEVCMHLGFG